MPKKQTADHTIELGTYFKKGDDFAAFLNDNRDNVVDAVRAWAKSLRECAEGLFAVARVMDGNRDGVFDADAGTHMAAVHISKRLLAALKKDEMACRAFDLSPEIEDDEID